MARRKKLKGATLPMKYNPGLAKYETELPVGKSNNVVKRKIKWWALIAVLLVIMVSVAWILAVL